MQPRWLQRFVLFASSGLLACSQVTTQTNSALGQDASSVPLVTPATWEIRGKNYPDPKTACLNWTSENKLILINVVESRVPPHQLCRFVFNSTAEPITIEYVYARCPDSYQYIEDFSEGICASNTVFNTEEELEGIWEVFLDSLAYKMLVLWNPQLSRYEGYLIEHGTGSQEAGYTLGELTWTANSKGNQEPILQSYKWRWKNNGSNYEEWLNGSNLSRANQDLVIEDKPEFTDTPLSGGSNDPRVKLLKLLAERARNLSRNTNNSNKPAPRTEPRNLEEQLSLQAAKGGEGTKLPIEIKDPRFTNSSWVKKSYYYKSSNPEVKPIEIHYWEDTLTGERIGFKFID